jgi:hypothetical protein
MKGMVGLERRVGTAAVVVKRKPEMDEHERDKVVTYPDETVTGSCNEQTDEPPREMVLGPFGYYIARDEYEAAVKRAAEIGACI